MLPTNYRVGPHTAPPWPGWPPHAGVDPLAAGVDRIVVMDPMEVWILYGIHLTVWMV